MLWWEKLHMDGHKVGITVPLAPQPLHVTDFHQNWIGSKRFLKTNKARSSPSCPCPRSNNTVMWYSQEFFCNQSGYSSKGINHHCEGQSDQIVFWDRQTIALTVTERIYLLMCKSAKPAKHKGLCECTGLIDQASPLRF